MSNYSSFINYDWFSHFNAKNTPAYDLETLISKPIVMTEEDLFHKNRELYHSINYNDTIPFIPPITRGKVIKVYDGDTITIAAKLPYAESPWYRFSVRLNGIDSPEIKGKTPAEKELAKNSRDALHNLIFGNTVDLRNIGTEKYGRILADVYYGEFHVNQYMIDSGYAVKYDGGTKIRPDEWNL